jgi:hypothetical protein
MFGIASRLRLLREAFSTDQEGRARYRTLERELAGFSTPAERLEIEEIVARHSDTEARDVRKILDRLPA